MKVTSAKDIKMPPLNILIYGDSGVGKTLLTSTAPTPILLLDMEGGTLSLRGRNVDIIKVKNPDDLRDTLRELKNGANYKTVVMDSITEMHKVFMDEIIKRNPNIARAYVDQPSLSDYGRDAELMRRIIRNFRDLPLNIVMTALVQDLKDERDGSIKRLPLLPGKLVYDVLGYMDIVGYMMTSQNSENGEIAREILMQPRGTIVAKDRSGKLGDVAEPNITTWMKLINEKGGNKK